MSSHVFEFLLFEGFSNMVLANALEPLRDVGLRGADADLSWRITTLDGGPVRSSSGLTVTPDGAFDPAAGATLVLVAGYRVREALPPAALPRVRNAARTAPLVVAADTASWLLAAAGLLEDHAATIHWQEFDAFQETFPKVTVTADRFVRSGKFLTCGGASTALDMMLDLIHDQFGAAAAFEASNMFLYDPNRQDRGPQRLRDRGSPKLLAALDTMASHIETPLTTFELADQVGLAERTLNRLFHRELGMGPGKYYKLLRLGRARLLAEETTLSQEQIALRCGFSSGVALARSFHQTYQRSLKDMRSR